ncbi:MAG: HEPN domain-containing protein [Clostridiales bacterium]|nr:HEPN domain-containing protein [Clostridiales bacterium]
MAEISSGLIYADILTARQALATYKENPRIKDIKNIAAYHLQQAAEKMIKAQIYRSGHPYKDREMYTHNLALLIAYTERNNIAVYIPEHIRKNSHIITGWEAGSRYDIHFSVRIDTLEKCLEVIEEWYKSICRKLK